MNEKLLHFIWQKQYYNPNELVTVSGEPLKVIATGTYNFDQGPDFKQARVQIRQTTWAGNIELHLRTSDWYRHQHQHDRNYDNVILHVVWKHDAEQNGVPVLELENRVPKVLLEKFEGLMNQTSFIPCEKMMTRVEEIHWQSWKDRLVAERLQRKSAVVLKYLEENKGNWEETCWWIIARNFGSRVNMAAFEEMAKSLSLPLLARHRSQQIQLESLFMGQAGLLREKISGDDYYTLLQREYHFFREKYRLKPVSQPVYFLRMRPGNFPTLRLAQLAALMHKTTHLFARIRDAADAAELRELFDVFANDYWHYHYRFGEGTRYREKRMGAVMSDSLLINAVVPLLFAYGLYHGDEATKQKAMDLLERTTAENNSITQGFRRMGVKNSNGYDSQAITELKNEYCNNKRCLECMIGNVLLKT